MRVRTEADQRFNEIAAQITEIPDQRLFSEIPLWSGEQANGQRQLRVARRVGKLIEHEFGDLRAFPALASDPEAPDHSRTLVYVVRPFPTGQRGTV